MRSVFTRRARRLTCKLAGLWVWHSSIADLQTWNPTPLHCFITCVAGNAKIDSGLFDLRRFLCVADHSVTPLRLCTTAGRPGKAMTADCDEVDMGTKDQAEAGLLAAWEVWTKATRLDWRVREAREQEAQLRLAEAGAVLAWHLARATGS